MHTRLALSHAQRESLASAVEEYECVVVLRVVDGGIRMGIGSTLWVEVISQ